MSARALLPVALLALCGGSAASDCNEASAVTGFNTTNYLGKWYQIGVSRQFFEQREAEYPLCVTAEYGLTDNGNVSVLNKGYNSSGYENSASGLATQADPNVGALEVKFGASPVAAPYDIIKLNTDENGDYTVALVWSCSFGGMFESLYVLAREPKIADSVYQEMLTYAASTGIDVAGLDMLKTVQNCTTDAPTPAPATPAPHSHKVTPWPFQCKSASPLTDFNATQYLGKWYQLAVSKQFFNLIEKSHPLCITAQYNLKSDGNIAVINTGYNEAGETNVANGQATLKDPTVGALKVSFFLPIFAAPYDIIYMVKDEAGQYKTALVWSCSLGGLVQSLWVLSREKTISDDEYNTVIDFALSSGIDVDRLDMLRTPQTCDN